MFSCAIRTRARKALWLLAALLASMAGFVVAGVLHNGWVAGTAFFLLVNAFWAAAIRALPKSPRISVWGFPPVIIPTFFIAILARMDGVLDNQLDALERDLAEQSRVSLTVQDIKAAMSEGIPPEEYPFPEPLNDKKLFGDLAEFFENNSFTHPPADEILARFEAHKTDFGEVADKVDAAIRQQAFNVASNIDPDMELLSRQDSPLFLSAFLSWAQWYELNACFAVWRGDAEAALECLEKQETLRRHIANKPHPLYIITSISLSFRKLSCLQPALPIMTEQTLEKLQSDMQTSTGLDRDLVRKTLLVEHRFFEDGLAHFTKTQIGYRKIFEPIFNLCEKLERRCALRMMKPFFQALNNPDLADAQLYDILAGEACVDRINNDMRMPSCRTILMPGVVNNFAIRITEYNRAALAAIAVERHRRRHGTLPETLDALVPEFLKAVPTSHFDGLPLDYQRGDICIQLDREKTEEFNGYRVSSRMQARFGLSRPWMVPAFNVARSFAPDAAIGELEAPENARIVAPQTSNHDDATVVP